ncbi:MAG TPA: DinB family protein [Candidatus Eisenbacteria bacterium]
MTSQPPGRTAPGKRAAAARRRLLQRLDAAWNAFRDSYAGLSPAELLEPGVAGNWSVRDVIAHVTWWEEEALKHLPLILDGGRPPRYSVTYGGIDAFNALKTGQTKGFSLPEVLNRQEEVHRRLVALVAEAPQDQLAGDTRFRRRLRLDTYGHYSKHAAAIRTWRWRRTAGPAGP